MTPLLQVSDLNAYYDQSHVLQGIDFEIPAGQVVSLLGRNGAGKSTTLKSIMGIVKPRAGTITFDGQRTTRFSTHRIARAGIAYVSETRDVFPSLSVRENLLLAARNGSGGEWTLDEIHDLFPRLKERADTGGAKLSGGEQQMLAIARALMTNPRLLLLDEPIEGLAPLLVKQIEEVLKSLKETGLTILLVEQNLAFATAFADTILILGKGLIRWRGTPEELRAADDVKGRWLGV
jgi:branched-chain amino acid transport system ATP-binding protein